MKCCSLSKAIVKDKALYDIYVKFERAKRERVL